MGPHLFVRSIVTFTLSSARLQGDASKHSVSNSPLVSPLAFPISIPVVLKIPDKLKPACHLHPIPSNTTSADYILAVRLSIALAHAGSNGYREIILADMQLK